MTKPFPPRIDVACYYRAPLKAALLRDAVLPAVRRLDERGVTAHVERHWLHGPHVRVRITGPARDPDRSDRDLDQEAGDVAAQLRAYLAEHPSYEQADEAQLLARAESSGRAELVPGPYTPIHPDNTVRLEAPDDGRISVLLGSELLLGHRAELLRAGLDPVRHGVEHLLRRGNTSSDRVWLALTAMAVHAAAYPPGIMEGHQSFRSHLEDFLHLNDPSGALRARFEGAWLKQADRATAHVDAACAAAAAEPAGDGTGAPDPAAAWARWVAHAWRVCAPAHRRGELPLPGEGYLRQAQAIGDRATVERWDSERRTSYSEYHRALMKMDFLDDPGVAEYFGAYRFATNILYLVLALCDVTAIERYLAAHLLSRAVPRLACDKEMTSA